MDAIIDYNSNLQALASRGIVPDELFQEIANIGVDATQNIAAMNTMTDEELKQYFSERSRKCNEQDISPDAITLIEEYLELKNK